MESKHAELPQRDPRWGRVRSLLMDMLTQAADKPYEYERVSALAEGTTNEVLDHLDALSAVQPEDAFDNKAWAAWLRLVMPRYKDVDEKSPLWPHAEGYNDALDECFEALSKEQPPFRIGVQEIKRKDGDFWEQAQALERSVKEALVAIVMLHRPKGLAFTQHAADRMADDAKKTLAAVVDRTFPREGDNA